MSQKTLSLERFVHSIYSVSGNKAISSFSTVKQDARGVTPNSLVLAKLGFVGSTLPDKHVFLRLALVNWAARDTGGQE